MYPKLVDAIKNYSTKPFPECFLDFTVTGCYDNLGNSHKNSCICGEHLRWEYIVSNTITKQNFIVGSVCIESIKSIIDHNTRTDVIEAINNLVVEMKKHKDKHTKTYCDGCKVNQVNKYRYNDFLRQRYCKRCYDHTRRKFVCKSRVADENCYGFTYNNKPLANGQYPDKCLNCWKHERNIPVNAKLSPKNILPKM